MYVKVEIEGLDIVFGGKGFGSVSRWMGFGVGFRTNRDLKRRLLEVRLCRLGKYII